ncbi:MAG: DsrE/DsrF/DrsH-like family protein [Rhodospirillaceae bacterium]|nr:DsrE/DsrF/DrsH-like family protein [Rhodospirillaceae bacterium]
MSDTVTTRPDKLSIVLFSGDYDKVHYALVLANASAAIDVPVTLFFTMGAARALLAPNADGAPAWRTMPVGGSGIPGGNGGEADDNFKSRTVADFEELLRSSLALGVKFMVCEMGLHALDLQGAALRDDVPITVGGAVTFINDASATGQMLFI